MKPSEKNTVLLSPLFRGVEKEQAEPLLESPQITVQSIEKGKTIYSAASFSRSLGVILKGSARVEKTCEQKKIIMSTLTKGNLFGMAALFYEEEPYPTIITAIQDCVIALLPKEWLLACFQAIPKTAENYITLLSARIHFLNTKIDTLGERGEKNTFYTYLLGEYRRRGQNGRVTLQYNMAELAKVLGIGRTTLYRELELLTESGKIIKQGKTITFIYLEEIS